jgi:PKD repeat protein
MWLVPVAQAAASEPLRGQWHLEAPQCFPGSDAPCVEPDSSGNDLTGKDHGAVQTVPGRWGEALHFPTKGESVDAGNQPLLQPATVTVLAWVRASGTPGALEYVVSQGTAGGCTYSSYGLYTGDDVSALRFYIFNGTAPVASPRAGEGIWDGAWHMVAGTYDGAAVRLYVDGQEVGSGTATSGAIGYGLAANNNFTIGNYAGPSECVQNTNFAGDVDEVRVYGRALTATEIARLAAATGPIPPDLVPDGSPPPPPTSGPVASFVERGISKKLTGALSVSGQTSTASAGAQIADYHWVISGPDKTLGFDCGGGSTSMSHPFRKAGTYSLALTVTDTYGAQARSVAPLTVTGTEIVPKLLDPSVFDCETVGGQQPGTKDCVKSFGFGIVDVNSRGGPEDCFEIVPRINPGIFINHAGISQAEQVSPNALRVYHASIGGRVAINGLYVPSVYAPLPKGVKTEYDTYDSSIALKGLDSVSLQVGPFPTLKVPLNLKVTPDKHGVFHVVNVDAAGNAPKLLGGLPVRGAFSIDLIYHASRVKLGLGLPSIFSFQGTKAAQGDAYLISDNINGVRFDGIGLLIPEVWVGPIFVSQLSFKYLKSENVWQGAAKVTLPGSPIVIDAASPPPDFGFGLKNGRFDHAGFGVEFPPLARPDLFPPFHAVLLSHVGAALGLNPLRLTGTIGLSSADVVDEDGVLFAAFATPSTPYEFPADAGEQLAALAGRTLDTFTLAVGGTASLHVPVLGVLPLLHSYGLYEYPDYFELGGGFTFELPLLKVDGDVNGFVFASKRLFNLEGGVKGCLRGVELDYKISTVKIDPCLINVGAVISSKGIGFCGIVPVPFPIFGVIPVEIGAGYTWGASAPEPKLFTCDYSAYRVVSPKAAAADTPYAIHLPAGLPAAMIRVRGQGGSPSVTVTDPHGKDAAADGDAIFLRRAGENTTFIGLRRPAAGRWTIIAKPGSPPISAVASADGLPKLSIKASVRGSGRRRALTYQITGAAGRTISFAERGPRTARLIAVARRASGRIAFEPAPGTRGRRSIIALVETSGSPARTLTVASYTPPPPARPAPPRHVRATRRRGTIRVRWRAVPGIVRYELLVELADGSEAFRVVRGSRATLTDPFPRKRGLVLVDSLGTDGSRSTTANAKLR